IQRLWKTSTCCPNSSTWTSNRRKKTGGERGIRTLDTGFSPYSGLANRRLQPLGHLSPARNAAKVAEPLTGGKRFVVNVLAYFAINCGKSEVSEHDHDKAFATGKWLCYFCRVPCGG